MVVYVIAGIEAVCGRGRETVVKFGALSLTLNVGHQIYL